MWRLCCPYFFLFFPPFCASGGLCFVIVAFPGYPHIFWSVLGESILLRNRCVRIFRVNTVVGIKTTHKLHQIYLLRGLDTVCRFSSIFNKGDNFCHVLFAFLHTNSLLKRVYSKRKEFALSGSKFFPFRVDLFSEERKNKLELLVLKMYTVFLI